MENIFDKFKKLNLDTSPIGLSIELREPIFLYADWSPNYWVG